MSFVIYPGQASTWVDFVKQDEGVLDAALDAGRGELERFRTLVESLAGSDTGVRVIGNVSPLSHYGDIVKLARVPAIFARDRAEADNAGAAPDAAHDLTPPAAAPVDERRWNRAYARANVRVLVRVSELVLDEAGNARAALIEHLDGTGHGPRWIDWAPGRRICLNGFRVELRATKRAGLHLRIGVVVEDSPRDANGYRTTEPRFISTVKIERNGLLVIRPHDPVEPAYDLDIGAQPADEDESRVLAEAAVTYYLASPVEAALYAAGLGMRLAGRAPEYALTPAA